MNEVDDVRPVLDFYKAQRGEDKILETFRFNQAQLRAEEERQRAQMEQMNQQGVRRGMGGPISTFSLGRRQQVLTVKLKFLIVTEEIALFLLIVFSTKIRP